MLVTTRPVRGRRQAADDSGLRMLGLQECRFKQGFDLEGVRHAVSTLRTWCSWPAWPGHCLQPIRDRAPELKCRRATSKRHHRLIIPFIACSEAGNGCLLKAEVFSTPSGEERQTPRHEYQTCSPPQEDYADDTPENGETLVNCQRLAFVAGLDYHRATGLIRVGLFV